MAGQVALVGSGEYLETMRDVDAALLAKGPARAAYLPTAAGREGKERIAYWMNLADAHFRAMGVEPVPIPVIDRADAQREDLARQIVDVGLIYLSGGSPAYLTETLRGSAVWQAILDAYEDGASLAGCSAGACALSGIASGFRETNGPIGLGLGVVPSLAVIPHFDLFVRRNPDIVPQFLARIPAHMQAIGIDENTALVGGPDDFVVQGLGSVSLLSAAHPTQLRAGEHLAVSS